MARFSATKLICILFLLSALPGTAAWADQSLEQPTDFDTWCRELDARPEARSGLFFSPLIGQELDARESTQYNLFTNTRGFLSARLPVDKDGRFRLELTLRRPGIQKTMARRFRPASLRMTRLHIYLSELYFELPPFNSVRQDEADLLWRMALRFAARGRYDLTQAVLEDLNNEFRETDAGLIASRLLPDVRALRANRQALIWDQPEKLGEGSNDLKLFGGYYGLWLGLAIPLAFESNSTEAYGAGLIAGGPTGYILASMATRRWNITEGRATMIELGGNLGTWQGLGWAINGDTDSPGVVGVGVLTGLAGIGAATFVSSKYEFTEGHASLTSAAMPWGAWFGLVASIVADNEDNEAEDTHKAMMIGGDALVLATGLLARQSTMSEKRVRLISLNGIIGGVMGGGVDLLVQPEDGETAMAIIGIGSALGLVAGYQFTKGTDQDKYAGETMNEAELAASPSFQFPQITVQPNLMTGRGVMPAVGAGIQF